MAYLVKDDFTRFIAVDLLDEILAQAAENSGFSTDDVLTNAINQSMAEVKGYLNKLFNMSTEYAKDSADTDRNENILRATIHIAIYNAHFTCNPHDIPEMRQKIYEKLTGKDGELAQVREGILDWELPEYPDDDDGNDPTDGYGRTTLKSARKFISKEFTDPQIIEPDEE